MSEEVAAIIIHQRRLHTAAVLKAQELMQERNKSGVDVAMLAKVVSMSSSKCVKRAQLRALW